MHFRRGANAAGILLALWALAVVGVFLAAGLAQGFHLELWSAEGEPPFAFVQDALIAADGSLWVYGGAWDRISRYDPGGRFALSRPGLGGGGSKILAADEKGAVFALSTARGEICRLWPDPEPRPCRRPGGDVGHWRLLAEGPTWVPEPLPPDWAEGDHRSLVAAGGVIPTGDRPFRASDGTTVRPRWGSFVEIRSPDGDREWRTGPWHLLFLQVPFPGFLVVIAAVLVAHRQSRRRPTPK